MQYNKTQEEFEQELLSKLNGTKFITRKWAESPNMIFYYESTDIGTTYEVGVWSMNGSYEFYR